MASLSRLTNGAARSRVGSGRRRGALVLGVVLAVTVSLVGPLSPAHAKKVYPSTNDIQAAQSKAAKTRTAVTIPSTTAA